MGSVANAQRPLTGHALNRDRKACRVVIEQRAVSEPDQNQLARRIGQQALDFTILSPPTSIGS